MKILLILLAINFIADQLFQSKTVMENKHKDSTLLIVHVLHWSVLMLIFASIIGVKTGLFEQCYKWWAAITVMHFSVEWINLMLWTYSMYNNKKSRMVAWILLEQLIINISIVSLFVYLLER